MSGRTCDVAPARAGEGLGTPGPGAGAWPGRPGALLAPLPATRSRGIIIAITQELNQAVVLTSLVLSGSVIMSRDVTDPCMFYSCPPVGQDFEGV